jgi:hypothetical protein
VPLPAEGRLVVGQTSNPPVVLVLGQLGQPREVEREPAADRHVFEPMPLNEDVLGPRVRHTTWVPVAQPPVRIVGVGGLPGVLDRQPDTETTTIHTQRVGVPLLVVPRSSRSLQLPHVDA